MNLAVITYMSSPCHIQYADFSEKEREQCYASTTNSSVLCGLNPLVYIHTGRQDDGTKEGIK